MPLRHPPSARANLRSRYLRSTRSTRSTRPGYGATAACGSVTGVAQ